MPVEGVTEESIRASLNPQFKYEKIPELHYRLQTEYGEVSIKKKKLKIKLSLSLALYISR